MAIAELIAALEAATGPNYALECQISVAVGAPGDGAPKPYTASIDAALTLVPEGWIWDVSSSGCAWIMRDGDSVCDSQIVISGIENPIIALCIAALKAREATCS